LIGLQYTSVTDRRTDRQTPHHSIYLAMHAYASFGKKIIMLHGSRFVEFAALVIIFAPEIKIIL